eukprot:171317_1
MADVDSIVAHQKNASTEFQTLEHELYEHQSSGRLRARSLNKYRIEDEENVDRIERYLQHLKYCCKIYSGFDIYQMLSFRKLHKPSRQYTRTKPFKLLGCKYEIHIHSAYSDALLTALVIGLLQIVGIS